MSATNRGADRRPSDNYPTPSWVTRALLADGDGPIRGPWWDDFRRTHRIAKAGAARRVLEPACGEGAILAELARANIGARLFGLDIRADAVCQASTLPGVTAALGDFTGNATTLRRLFRGPTLLNAVDTIVTNPPYGGRSNLAWQFVARALEVAPVGAQIWFLLRLNWLGDGERTHQRASWLRDGNHPARVLILERRPSFTGNGRADASAYAWMLWIAGRRSPESRLRVIRCDEPYVSARLNGQRP